MGLKKQILERVFEHGDIKLPDPGHVMTPTEVLKFYTGQYPDLAISTTKYEGVKEGKAHYKIITEPGYRG